MQFVFTPSTKSRRFHSAAVSIFAVLIVAVLAARPDAGYAQTAEKGTPDAVRQDVKAPARAEKKRQSASRKTKPDTGKKKSPTGTAPQKNKTSAKATASAPKGFPPVKATETDLGISAKTPVAEAWRPLMLRLRADGMDEVYLKSLFVRIGDSYSHMPMGTKVSELFTIKYTPPAKKRSGKPGPRPSVYKSLVTPASVERCREYLLQHAVAFGAMEANYGVPKEVVAALLMVETRLGSYLGKDSAFWSLACLAAADSPKRVEPTLQKLKMTPDRLEWVNKILRERSDWAYKELLAFLRHSRNNDLDPLAMPGSVYGAIGICQFMPSNLPKFAVDGNSDGKIDLFEPADAIPSVANYLKKHGWKGSSREVHHKTLMRYNKSRIYANTILALSDAIAAPLDTAVAAQKTTKPEG